MSDLTCPNCGSSDYVKNGYSKNKKRRRLVCKKCGKEFRANSGEVHDTPKRASFTSTGDTSEFVVETEKRIRTVQELIELLEIDTNEWEIVKFSVSKSEGYRKDRKVNWIVENGAVVSGEVNDSGKLLIAPLYSVRVTLKRKTQEIRYYKIIDDLREDIKNYSFNFVPIKYNLKNTGVLFEIAMPDIHLGRMTWHEESGEDSDLKSQVARVEETIIGLLGYAKKFGVDRILLPIGNDFFNSDTILGTTTRGTPQQEDTRWQKTFRTGRQLAVRMIDWCRSVAPVDVLIVSGNHDETRTFYLGDALEAWYHHIPEVKIDNRACKRKYYSYGKILLGFSHGNNEKVRDLGQIMAVEEPERWASSNYREWHLGDKHHKIDIQHFTLEVPGVTIRTLRSLSVPDAWSYNKGYIGNQSAAEAFMWDENKGLLAQFNYAPSSETRATAEEKAKATKSLQKTSSSNSTSGFVYQIK